MSRRSSLLLSDRRQISEMNMTSLMDLTFMLLIAFVITFPLVEQGVPVRLPKGKAQALPEGSHVNVTLDRTGRIFVGEAELSLDGFAADMQAQAAADPQLTVLLRADEELPYGKVTGILQRLHEAGISRMALVTDPSGGAAAP